MIVIIVWICLLPVIFEISSRSVYGASIPEEQLDLFFNRYFDEYKETLNEKGFFYGSYSMPFIARATSPLCSWYISGYGRIYRWSKWSKKLNEVASHRVKPKKKNLLDLVK